MTARYKVRPNGEIWSVQEMYRGASLVWQAIRSCFGSGAWIGERPWLGDDPWKGI
ncbi:MAG: hypothetical protein II874_04155 [Bacteroidales bacterium]|nr:hypothetical protein [Bacteroidales bacterium]